MWVMTAGKDRHQALLAQMVRALPCLGRCQRFESAIGRQICHLALHHIDTAGSHILSEKKKILLGMNPSTASARLVKDLLWNFVKRSGHSKCYRCGIDMNRDTFSIEHKDAWMDSLDPVSSFFSIENIDYSHISCNVSAGASRRTVHESHEAYLESKSANSRVNRPYSSAERRAQYARTGK